MSKKDTLNGATIVLGIASIFAGPGGALAAYASVVRGAQVALTVYGLYSGYRQSQKAAAASNSGLEDRTVSIASIEYPRSVVYGRRIVKGRPVFWVEPKNGTRVNEPNYYFWMVYAFEPGHEIDGFEEVYFNGEAVGPFIGPLHWGMTDVATGSKFYRNSPTSNHVSGIVGAGGKYILPMAPKKLLSVTVTDPQYVDNGDQEGEWTNGRASWMASPIKVEATLSGSSVQIDAKYAGWPITVHYEWDKGGPYVAMQGYLGTASQTVNKAIQQADPTWNDNCRLRGTPYLVIRIDPDSEMFQSGVPVVTALIRGMRCYDPWTGTTGWTANPAHHIYDYLTIHCKLLPSEINLDRLLAVRNSCDESVRISNDRQTGVARFEKRFESHAILSTENGRLDNFRVLLSTIGGSSTFSDGQYQIRASVSEFPSGSLNEDQLGSGNIVVQPRPSVFEGFNAVRGVFVNAEEKYMTLDYPPYQSEYYVSLDHGSTLPQQIDFSAVTSAHQAQRIARMQLHLARNTMTFEATWTIAALQYSPGEVITVNLPQFGWTAKPFRVQKREMLNDGQVGMIMREEAASVYSFTYQEGVDPDPSPNTDLPSPYDIAAVTGMTIESGPSFTEYEAGGQVKPAARVRWDLHTTKTVLYGGNIEIWFRWESWEEWQKEMLSGTATRFDLPIRYNRTVIVQVRGVNALGIPGPWTIQSHTGSGAPTSAVAGYNLLANPLFQGWTINGSTTPSTVNIPGWHSRGTQFDGDKTLMYWEATGSGPMAGIGAYFKNKSPNQGEVFDAWSTPVVLGAGTERMLAFADLNLLACDGAVGITFIGPNNEHIATYRGDWITQSQANFYGSPYFGRAYLFCAVPSGATAASFVVSGRVDRSRYPGSLPQVFFRTPQLSIASPNQVTLPDWTP